MLKAHSTRNAQSAQTLIILSDNSIVPVPEGADPDAYRHYCETKLRLAANPRKAKKHTYVRSSKPSKRVNYAERVLSAASPFDAGMQATARRMADIADEQTFVSGPEWDDDAPLLINGYLIPFSGEPCPYESEADDYGLRPVW